MYYLYRYGSYEHPVKQINAQYKVQPGKIENYTPGKSSISDKEAKQVKYFIPTRTSKASSKHDNDECVSLYTSERDGQCQVPIDR